MAKVFVTNGNSILITNLEGSSTKSLRQLSTMRRLTAFDYHNRTGRIYWADRQIKTIFSAFENGSDVRRLVTSGIDTVEALAIDWIGENMYWTDYALEHIEVAKLDGTRRKILFNVTHLNFISFIFSKNGMRFALECLTFEWQQAEKFFEESLQGFKCQIILFRCLSSTFLIELNQSK
jgi:hypothetical protein